MCNVLVWSFDAVTSINWFEVIKALASVATTIIAFFALRNWQRQDKAKREAEFLDALIESTHAYIAEMPTAMTHLEMAKIGMESYIPTREGGNHDDKALTGAIAYIQKSGEQDAKRLISVLETARPPAIKLRSLVAKGQVFKFDGYAKCQDSVTMLTWHLDRIEAFAEVIGSPAWNWGNPNVLTLLKSVMAIDLDEMRKNVKENNIAILEFARGVYERMYG